MPFSSASSASPASSPHVLSREATQLLERLSFPLPHLRNTSSPLLPTDTLSLLDLLLNFNDTYALSFWVLRSLASELRRTEIEGKTKENGSLHTQRVPPASASASPSHSSSSSRAEVLLAACESIQQAKDTFDQHLGRLVLRPLLLSCLFFYVDATAYDAAALRRDVTALLAPGGGPARYCVDEVEEAEAEDDSGEEDKGSDGESNDDVGESNDTDSDNGPLSKDAAAETYDKGDDDSEGERKKEEKEGGSSQHGNGALFSASRRHPGTMTEASAATRRRWRRERARLASLSPPQSDVAVLLLNLVGALHKTRPRVSCDCTQATSLPFSLKTLTNPSQAACVCTSQSSTHPWLQPSEFNVDFRQRERDIRQWQHNPSVVSVLLRRSQGCLTRPLSLDGTAHARPHQTPTSISALDRERSSGQSTIGAAVAHLQLQSTARDPFRSFSGRRTSAAAYAQYCEGLRRRRGARPDTAPEEADGVIIGAQHNARVCPPSTQSGAVGLDGVRGLQRGAATSFTSPIFVSKHRNRFLLDPFAGVALRRHPLTPLTTSASAHAPASTMGGRVHGVSMSSVVSAGSLPNHISDSLPATTWPERKRQRSDAHWSDVTPPHASFSYRSKVHETFSCDANFSHRIYNISDKEDHSNLIARSLGADSLVDAKMVPHTLTRRLPLELQRLCLEYVSPRYLRTASIVCAAWYHLIRPTGQHSACQQAFSSASVLQQSYEASRAVTRIYTDFFQRQWGEQSLPVTRLTSLHRLRLLAHLSHPEHHRATPSSSSPSSSSSSLTATVPPQSFAVADLAVVQRHWLRVRRDPAVCAYVLQRLLHSPLRHLVEDEPQQNADVRREDCPHQHCSGSEETSHLSFDASSTRREIAGRERGLTPLSAAQYVFYVLCVMSKCAHLTLSSAECEAGEEARVCAALPRLLSAWSTEVKWNDIWSFTNTSSAVSAVLTKEAVRQQMLLWWVMTTPPNETPGSAVQDSRKREDFAMQLWSEWETVREVWHFSETAASAF